MYADDLKLYIEITSIADCERLQNALNRVEIWCNSNSLPLNAAKCNVMTFSRKSNPEIFAYNLNDSLLQRPNTVKDLGVIFDKKLTFSHHIEAITLAAFKRLGFIIRNLKGFRNIHTLRLLYLSLVRSRLEYASLVWNPIYNVHITSLEKIQRRFLKSAVYTLDGEYPPRGIAQEALLSRFQLTHLESRRCMQSIIFLYKLINNKLDCTSLLNLITYRVPRVSSRHNNVFYIPTARTNILIASPLYQMILNYSNLEDRIDIFFCNISQIKSVFLN